jgi:hypothetical protein
MAKVKIAVAAAGAVPAIGGDVPTNDAAHLISFQAPYSVEFGVEGVCPLIFHRWSVEGVAEKAGAAKGSKAKKTDDIES